MGYKVEIQITVSVNVGDGQAIAVVIMDGYIVFSHIIHNLVAEENATLFNTIGETKVVNHLEFIHSLELCLAASCKPWWVDGLFRLGHFLH